MEPVIIIDLRGNLVEVNNAASNLLNIKTDESVGKKLEEAIPAFPTLTSAISGAISTEISMGSYWGVRHYSVDISDLKDRKNRRIGTLVIMHDITKRKALENELLQMASTDALTGASNRRHLFELAEREYSRAKRYDHDLCAVMIDIDRFKQLNDNYGHDVGDEALKRLVSICKEGLRSSDLFGRVGGEEFVAVLTDQNLEQSMLAAERLRTRIAEIIVPVPGGKIGFTASLGVAPLTEADTSFDDLLKRADNALYSAKRAGRNCVRNG
jgi:diguanylate cyclase (GGDEF)-like protein/PAS domain S-box-containing protein